MPRKSSMDIRGMDEPMSLEKAARKTERSHEENQERAYIAASRRADRSIEARVQSARMASDIHKKRTGKGFKISEDIVMKEEMYEEEDDDLPRSYYVLSSNMQTASLDMNERLDAYLTNKVAMSRMIAQTNEDWRKNEINRLFAASFPNVAPTGHPGPGSEKMSVQSPTYQPSSGSAGYSGGHFLPSSYSAATHQGSQAHQAQVRSSPILTSFSYQPRSRAPKRKSQRSSSVVKSRRNSSKSSPGPSAPSVPAKRTSVDSSPTAQTSPTLDTAISPLTPLEPLFSTESAFTTELPPETRMMLDGVGADAVLNQTLANQEDNSIPNWLDTSDFLGSMAYSPNPITGVDDAFMNDIYGNGAEDSMPSKCTMPNFQSSMEGAVDWGNFINDSMWTNE